jgi:hypothetical protein
MLWRIMVVSNGQSWWAGCCRPKRQPGNCQMQSDLFQIKESRGQMPSFSALRDNYPKDEKQVLFRDVLGGGFPALIDKPSYKNTCAIRLSVALHRSGFVIPADIAKADGNHKDKDGKSILVKVEKMRSCLVSIIGPISWGISKQPGTPLPFADFPKRTSIVMYRSRDFNQATGHVDLWTGSACWFGCPNVDVNTAFEVEAWYVH